VAKNLKVKSRSGRTVVGVVLAGTLIGLWMIISSAIEQHSWASTRGVVLERFREGAKSASVEVSYRLPDGREQVATLSENGPARHPGEQVEVRYDLRDGQVVDAALADNDEAFWVAGGMLGLMALGGLVLNVRAWLPEPAAQRDSAQRDPANGNEAESACPHAGRTPLRSSPRGCSSPKQHPRSRYT
jgi:hypothetical protein